MDTMHCRRPGCNGRVMEDHCDEEILRVFRCINCGDRQYVEQRPRSAFLSHSLTKQERKSCQTGT
jgi:hypothetical protein